jgi:aminopeptidase N
MPSPCPRCCAASARRWCWTSTTPMRELLTPAGARHRPFNRWEAGQRLALRIAINHIAGSADLAGATGTFELNFWALPLWRPCAPCCATPLDAAFKELVLTLPSETYIAEQLDVVDPQRIHAVREAMRTNWPPPAGRLGMGLGTTPEHRRLPARPGVCRPPRTGRHGLHMLCLAAKTHGRCRLARQGLPALQGRRQHDRPLQRAVTALVASGHDLAAPALAASTPVQGRTLVLDKWFALQAGRARPGRQRAAHRAPADAAPGLQPQATPTARAA